MTKRKKGFRQKKIKNCVTNTIIKQVKKMLKRKKNSTQNNANTKNTGMQKQQQCLRGVCVFKQYVFLFPMP